MEIPFFVLLGYCVFREIFFVYNTNKLLNKLMSRNYYDYQFSDKMKRETPKKSDKIYEDDLAEDLGVLAGIQ